jgi:hypothetical protein
MMLDFRFAILDSASSESLNVFTSRHSQSRICAQRDA